MSAESEQVLLPEHLRLPDLSGIKHVTREGLDRWCGLMFDAALWGDVHRNGARREFAVLESRNAVLVEWRDADSRLHSPDPWTPAKVLLVTPVGRDSAKTVCWMDHGSTFAADDQPDELTATGVAWHDSMGYHHRRHAPAHIGLGTHTWAWQGDGVGTASCYAAGSAASARVRELRMMDAAWLGDLSDEEVLDLLALAAEHDRARAEWLQALVADAGHLMGDLVPDAVTWERWVAHVLAANPSTDLSATTRAWIRLLAE